MNEAAPTRSLAWRVHEYGDPADVLHLEQVERVAPGPGCAAVAFAACALNFADDLQCRGTYQIRAHLPFTPGLEAAGTVVAVGPDVTSVGVGTRVVAQPEFGEGAFRQHAVVPVERLFPIPDSMGFTTAAAMYITYHTAFLALHRRAALRAGETLLVHAGAGGVGSAAIQVGLATGATVLATAGGPEKVAICRRLGVHHAIDYTATDFAAVVNELTAQRGADVIFDPVGGEVFERSRKCIASEGRLLVVGFAGGSPGKIAANHVLVKNYSVMGVFFPPGPLQVQLAGGYHARMVEWFESGLIDPLVSRVIDFEHIPQALGDITGRTSFGKVVARIGPADAP